MHEEMIDIYDENMKKIGYAVKKDVHRLGLWHKSIHCWLFTRVGDCNYVIVQKRSSKKLLMPNYYDVSVAGHYERSESREDGFREIGEEFGIKVKKEDLTYLGIKYDVGISENAINKEFCEVFFAETKESIYDFKMSPREVDEVVMVSVKDGQKLFSGEIDELIAEGIKWNCNMTGIEKTTVKLTRESFIPRTDPYYSKIFAIADLYFMGYKYLYI